MDELKITAPFAKRMISSIIMRKIKKKIGYDIDIHINDLNVVLIDGRANLHVNLDAGIDNDDLDKLLFKIVK